MKLIYSKSTPLLSLIHEPKLGAHYHVSWAGHGVVGICVSIDHTDKTVRLKRPKTHTIFKNPIKWSELRHTRATQRKIENNKL